MKKRGRVRCGLAAGSFFWVLVALVGLVLLGARYADFAVHERQGFQWCLENAKECDGREIRLPVWDVVSVDKDHYRVFKTTGPIPVKGSTEGIAAGDTLSIRAHFDADSGWLVEVERELHALRPWKKALSGLGLLLFLVGLPRYLSVKDGRLFLRG